MDIIFDLSKFDEPWCNLEQLSAKITSELTCLPDLTTVRLIYMCGTFLKAYQEVGDLELQS